MGRIFGHAIDAFWSEGKLAVFPVRGAIDLKGEIGSPAYTDIRSLKETKRRIKPDGKVVGQVRGWLDGQTITHGMVPVFGFDDLYIGLDAFVQPAFPVDHLGQFTNT